ncbi:hypothetical protein SAMN06297387_110151 [Streptomyces zhaozhouensis]|uniref:Methyltransferase domain-containing protein n=1 Tax=Streptomyces zhaozhouensis TaxID=1300267 RepID=A0A286DXM9_9ACTN|nr:class I SAM-dependent methyltransferase [Streptomyces zhaozhouensis]SOD63419.1 hypothetical protein SAMN06297387_110151 [Streptomyces zhaozhouensis]
MPEEYAYPYRQGLSSSGPFPSLTSRVADVLADRLPSRAWDVVVDLGCGNGRLSRRLADRLTVSTGWILLDRDRRLLVEAHRGLCARGDRAVPVVAHLDAAPLAWDLSPARSLVLVSHVLYYLHPWQPLMRGLIDRSRGSRPTPVVVVVLHSRRSDSYVLRHGVRVSHGEARPRMAHAEEFAAWLAERDVPWTRYRVSASYRPTTRPIGLGLRTIAEEDGNLRALLRMLGHADPLAVEPSVLAAFQRVVARDGRERPPVFAFHEDVFLLRGGRGP